jgi:hypothetical protein
MMAVLKHIGAGTTPLVIRVIISRSAGWWLIRADETVVHDHTLAEFGFVAEDAEGAVGRDKVRVVAVGSPMPLQFPRDLGDDLLQLLSGQHLVGHQNSF